MRVTPTDLPGGSGADPALFGRRPRASAAPQDSQLRSALLPLHTAPATPGLPQPAVPAGRSAPAPLCGLGPVRPPALLQRGGRRDLRPSCRRPPAGRGEEREEEEECEGDSGAQDCAIGPGAIERPRRREEMGAARGEVPEGTESPPRGAPRLRSLRAVSGSALGGRSRGLAVRVAPPKTATKDPSR